MYRITIIFFSILFFAACQKKVNTTQSSTSTTQQEEAKPVLVSNTDEFREKGETTDETPVLDHPHSVDVIAFGSCNKTSLPMPMWGPILQTNPDLWIWLGDNIYGDSDDEAVLTQKYNTLKSNIGYQKLTKICPIIGTWDDHDYGDNDGNKHFTGKEASKAAFMKFFNTPSDSPIRDREGIYQSYTFGQGKKQVKVIILDTRTFRDKVVRGPLNKVYIPDPEADILGETQWKWFEEELKNSTAPITLVVNGTQVISRFHPFEKWGNYPTSRRKLFKLIKTHRPSGVILLSGDRHHAEVSKVNIPDMKHPLYEFTSSGLTHTRKYPKPEANKFRVGKKINDLNFGTIKIDWDASPLKVTLQIKGVKNNIIESHELEIPE